MGAAAAYMAWLLQTMVDKKLHYDLADAAGFVWAQCVAYGLFSAARLLLKRRDGREGVTNNREGDAAPADELTEGAGGAVNETGAAQEAGEIRSRWSTDESRIENTVASGGHWPVLANRSSQ
eukprot:1194737-Prorocentrum_minimum.AAC.3